MHYRMSCEPLKRGRARLYRKRSVRLYKQAFLKRWMELRSTSISMSKQPLIGLSCVFEGNGACSSWSGRMPVGLPYLPLSDCHSVFDRHRGRINGFLAGDSLQPGQNAAIFVLVALHGEAALLISIRPGHTDKVLLRLAERHQRTQSKAHHANSNRGADAPVNVLAIAYFGDCGGRYVGDFFAVADEAHSVLIYEQMQPRAGLDVRQRAAIICNLVTDFTSEDGDGNDEAKQHGQKLLHKFRSIGNSAGAP